MAATPEQVGSYDPKSTPTARAYGPFGVAFDWLNARLFDGRLPGCVLTFQRQRRTFGYYAPSRFQARAEAGKADEIALNPDLFVDRSDAEVLSTLAHEQVHLWQNTFGDPGRRGYHNRQWADEMERIGLVPSDTGAPGGRRTGQRMSHYIVPGGPFDVAVSAPCWRVRGFASHGRADRPGAALPAQRPSLCVPYARRPPGAPIASSWCAGSATRP